MYLFYVLYVLSGALQTQSSPVTSETQDLTSETQDQTSGTQDLALGTQDLTNLDKIPFGEPCEAFGVCILILYLHGALDVADH